MSTEQDVRVASSSQMIMLASHSEKFNRSIDVDYVSEKLDPHGFNVMELVLPFHNEQNHHRVEVLMKFTDDDEAHQAFIDVPADMWDSLHTYAQLCELLQGIKEDPVTWKEKIAAEVERQLKEVDGDVIEE